MHKYEVEVIFFVEIDGDDESAYDALDKRLRDTGDEQLCSFQMLEGCVTEVSE